MTAERSIGWVSQGLLTLLKVYQRFLSPMFQAFGAECRFHPTCSAYAFEVIAREGPVVGTFRAVKRLLRCHPWHPGGFDPPYPNQRPLEDGRRFK